MKKYNYYISAVIDEGASSLDLKATTLKEAKEQLRKIKNMLNKSFKKESESIELYIDRSNLLNDEKQFENIYYRKVK